MELRQRFLNTIIINLISNAFSNTPRMGKVLKIEVDTNDENLLVLRVANEGSTIKEKDFQYVFNRYAILDNFENQDEKNFSRNGLGACYLLQYGPTAEWYVESGKYS